MCIFTLSRMSRKEEEEEEQEEALLTVDALLHACGHKEAQTPDHRGSRSPRGVRANHQPLFTPGTTGGPRSPLSSMPPRLEGKGLARRGRTRVTCLIRGETYTDIVATHGSPRLRRHRPRVHDDVTYAS